MSGTKATVEFDPKPFNAIKKKSLVQQHKYYKDCAFPPPTSTNTLLKNRPAKAISVTDAIIRFSRESNTVWGSLVGSKSI